MSKEEALTIISMEGLKGYNFFENRTDKEDEVVIKMRNNQWNVYCTDERASMITNSEHTYFSEADALEDFIERLRADKVYREL